jgi:predicted GIY-YIG superfamily endonuclease
MNENFRQHVESLHGSFELLMAMPPVKVAALPRNMPVRGVYLFSEKDAHLYTGRTNRMRMRLSEHCRKSSTHNSAPFAFLLAREACQMKSASYRKEGSRQSLAKHEVFGPAFVAAKVRVSNMDLRFVEEAEPLRQALLEMYVAVALRTPHNCFDNH